MMECLKNQLHFAQSLAKIAASRLMFTIGFKSGANHVKRSTATLARRNTTLPAKRVAKPLGAEAIAQKNVQIVRLQLVAGLVAMSLKKQVRKTQGFVRCGVPAFLNKSCILAAITLQRLSVMAISAVSAEKSNRPMFTILTCQGVLRKLIVKGAITT
jgi:hypothetical protein